MSPNIKQSTPEKHYLGDGLYAAFDGYHVVVTAEDGVRVTSAVYFDPLALKKFLRFIGGGFGDD